MKLLKQMHKIIMIDCAASRRVDPTPNIPGEIRQALSGTNIIAKVRIGHNLDEITTILQDLIDPSLRYIIELEYSESAAATNYQTVKTYLENLYTKG